MKTLIVEDDFTGRILLQAMLEPHGKVHMAMNGKEAVEAFRTAMDAGQPYDLICLDIMMPDVDGFQTLREIRCIEESQGILSSNGVKIMTTALDGVKDVSQAFGGLCDAYLVKPIDKRKLLACLRNFGLNGCS